MKDMLYISITYPSAFRLPGNRPVAATNRETTMKIEIKKIGNSTGLILPKELLGDLNLAQGDWVHVSRTPEGLKISRYDPDRHRMFRAAFESPERGSFLSQVIGSSPESSFAIVLENKSEKPMIALQYGWTTKKKDGLLSKS